MKKADTPIVVNVHIQNCTISNNKVSQGGKNILPVTIVIVAIAIVVLAVSLCCPDLLADFIRWIIGAAISN